MELEACSPQWIPCSERGALGLTRKTSIRVNRALGVACEGFDSCSLLLCCSVIVDDCRLVALVLSKILLINTVDSVLFSGDRGDERPAS